MAHKVITRRPKAANFRGFWLLVFGGALIPASVLALLSGKLGALAFSLGGFLLLVAAAWLTRRGIEQERVWKEKHLAASPAPLKKTALVVTAAASFVISWGLGTYDLLMGAVFAAFTAVGYYLFYGLDPTGEKIGARLGGYSTEELVEILQEADEKIADIEHQRIKLGGGELNDRLGRITDLARDITGVLERNPRELRNARKFLNVYLDGAQRVVADYTRIHDRTEAGFLETNFRDVLVTIEESFKSQREKLQANDVLDLDIQIEVLKKQLEEERIA